MPLALPAGLLAASFAGRARCDALVAGRPSMTRGAGALRVIISGSFLGFFCEMRVRAGDIEGSTQLSLGVLPASFRAVPNRKRRPIDLAQGRYDDVTGARGKHARPRLARLAADAVGPMVDLSRSGLSSPWPVQKALRHLEHCAAKENCVFRSWSWQMGYPRYLRGTSRGQRDWPEYTRTRIDTTMSGCAESVTVLIL
jgi:hypothetical protein